MNSYTAHNELVDAFKDIPEPDVPEVLKRMMENKDAVRFEIIREPVIPPYDRKATKKRQRKEKP
jgi:hypothetical protein